MATKVLVAYATKYGATAEIAERIGQVLRDAGLDADVLPANRVRDVSPYGAVVLGSAVYIYKWRKEAAKFLKTNEKALSERPVWLFSSGPTKGEMVAFQEGAILPEDLQPIADRIHPRDIAIFRGALEPSKMGAIMRFFVARAPEDEVGDFREWPVIEAWAKSIAEALK